MANSNKVPSLFCPGLEVGIDAHITELLISNHIDFHQKKSRKMHRPTCAFWRRDVAAQYPEFKELSTRYGVEIAYIKNLRKCFSPEAILKYIKEKGMTTFAFQKKNRQETLVYNIFRHELKVQKQKKEQAKAAKKIKDKPLTTEVQKKKTKSNPLTGIMTSEEPE